MMANRPRLARRCAICQSIAVNGHFCRHCYMEWGDQLESEWVKGMVKLNNHDYWLRRKQARFHTIPLDRVNI